MSYNGIGFDYFSYIGVLISSIIFIIIGITLTALGKSIEEGKASQCIQHLPSKNFIISGGTFLGVGLFMFFMNRILAFDKKALDLSIGLKLKCMVFNIIIIIIGAVLLATANIPKKGDETQQIGSKKLNLNSKEDHLVSGGFFLGLGIFLSVICIIAKTNFN